MSVLRLAIFAIISFLTTYTNAQSFPDKPIKLVIPFPPGGSTDVIARILSKPLGEELKTTIIIDKDRKSTRLNSSH